MTTEPQVTRPGLLMRPGWRHPDKEEVSGSSPYRPARQTVRLEDARRAHNRDMTREHRYPARRNMAAALRRVLDRIRNWRRRSPPAGVREPRRPKPALPAAAVALEEPRVRTARWIRLVSRRSEDQ